MLGISGFACVSGFHGRYDNFCHSPYCVIVGYFAADGLAGLPFKQAMR